MTNARNRLALLVALTVVTLGVGVAVVIVVGTGSNRAAATTAAVTADTVSVSGSGSVEGVPDTLVASLHVHAREPSVQSALNDSATDARQVIAALHHGGVAQTDIRTSDVSLDPSYNDHGQIDGYDSGESLSVHIHPLSGVGKILTAASTAAGNSVSIDGLSYDIADNTALLAGARANAFANAKSAAAQYAQLSGRTLNHVVSVVSVVTGGATTTPTDAKGLAFGTASAAGTTPVPVDPGQQKVGVTVKVIWALN
jgi:uncharacterized protein